MVPFEMNPFLGEACWIPRLSLHSVTVATVSFQQTFTIQAIAKTRRQIYMKSSIEFIESCAWHCVRDSHRSVYEYTFRLQMHYQLSVSRCLVLDRIRNSQKINIFIWTILKLNNDCIKLSTFCDNFAWFHFGWHFFLLPLYGLFMPFLSPSRYLHIFSFLLGSSKDAFSSSLRLSFIGVNFCKIEQGSLNLSVQRIH